MKVFNRSRKAQFPGNDLRKRSPVRAFEITGTRIMETLFALPFGMRSRGIHVDGVNKKVRENNTGGSVCRYCDQLTSLPPVDQISTIS